MMKPVFRFLGASLAAALSALLALTLVMPLYLLVGDGAALGSEPGITAVAAWMMLPFVLLIGGPIALPLAAVAGGAMLWWQYRRGSAVSGRGWIIAGLGAGTLVALFMSHGGSVPVALANALWFASAGAVGAWVFRRVWG